jgi:hypothetical protein
VGPDLLRILANSAVFKDGFGVRYLTIDPEARKAGRQRAM